MNKIIVLILTFILTVPTGLLSSDIKLPPIDEKIFDNGLEVVVIENHELPVVSMRMVIKSGSAFDPAGKAGLASLTAGLLRKGTKSRTATEVAEAIDFVGGSLSGSANRDASNISCSVLLKHLGVGLDVLSDIILNPAFADDEIERLRNQKLSSIMQSKDNPSSLCTKGFNKVLFDEHPYGQPTIGTENTLSAVTANDIKAFYKSYYKPNNAIFVVAGDIKPEDIFKAVEEVFGKWQKGEIPAITFPEVSPPKDYSILLIDKPDATQTNIRFGHFGINRNDKDYYSLLLMNYVLGSSFTSRLMQTVRVEKGLTYDIRTVNEYNIMPAAYYCNTFTENDSTIPAIQASIAEIRKMKEELVSDEEYNEAVNFYAGDYPMSLETPSDVASEIIKVKLYGLPVSYIEDFTKNIRKITKQDMLKAAQNHLDPDNMVFSIVSKAADIEEKLKTLGTVKKITIDEM